MGTTPRFEEVTETIDASHSLFVLVPVGGASILNWTRRLLCVGVREGEADFGEVTSLVFLFAPRRGEGKGTTPSSENELSLLLEEPPIEPNGLPRAALIVIFGLGLIMVFGLPCAFSAAFVGEVALDRRGSEGLPAFSAAFVGEVALDR